MRLMVMILRLIVIMLWWWWSSASALSQIGSCVTSHLVSDQAHAPTPPTLHNAFVLAHVLGTGKYLVATLGTTSQLALSTIHNYPLFSPCVYCTQHNAQCTHYNTPHVTSNKQKKSQSSTKEQNTSTNMSLCAEQAHCTSNTLLWSLVNVMLKVSTKVPCCQIHHNYLSTDSLTHSVRAGLDLTEGW